MDKECRTGGKEIVDKHLRGFSDSSRHCDYYSTAKVNARYSDMKHMEVEDGSALEDTSKPGLNSFAWNKRLGRCVKTGHYQKTIELFQQMQQEGINPNAFSFVPVLNACARLGALTEGKRTHLQIIQAGCESDVYVGSSLISMYAKCGSIEDARRVFDVMQTRNVVCWNAMILGHVKCGQGDRAVQLFQQMHGVGMQPNSMTFVGILNACASLAALEEGRRVHQEIIKINCENIYVSNSLVDMYSKCGSIVEARSVFNEMPTHNVVSWNALIPGYVRCGLAQTALDLYGQMREEGVEPNAVTFVGVLNACASLAALDEGRQIHSQIFQSGCESNVFVGNSLIDMYAKCDSIEDAEKVFNHLLSRNVVSWNAMILGYVKCGYGRKALELFAEMQGEGVQPDHVTFVGVLNACAIVPTLDEGRHVHKLVIQRHCESNVFVGSSLVDMYAKCGSIEDAERVFCKMPIRNVVSWNAMILGCVNCGQEQKALELYHGMHVNGVEPNMATFVALLKACAIGLTLEEGILIHRQIIERGWESDVVVGGSLVDLYAKCGRIEDAWRVFSKMPMRNVVSWNSMILGYVKCGQGVKALQLSRQMQQDGLDPDPVTFVGILTACASLVALEEGRFAHRQIIEKGYGCNVYVSNCLVDMYAKCGSIEEAHIVFSKIPSRNVVSWNALIMGYVKCGQGQKALQLSQQMQSEGLEPNQVTFLGLLNACTSAMNLEEGRRIHDEIIQSGFETDTYVGNCLVDMYAKCGSIEDAWRVFHKMSTRGLVSWNSMILGCVKCQQGLQALELYKQMILDGVDPDSVTFVGVLNACASVGALEEGRRVHEQIIQSGLDSDVYVGSCLIDMYAKCGSIEDAQKVFNTMPVRNVVSWTAMLGGYAMHGLSKEALAHFDRMSEEGVEMNELTFSNLLSACGHAGLLDEGLHHFESMGSVHHIPARVQHYACIVDLLGRHGHLHEAEDLIKTMSCAPDATVWMALLGACRCHRNVEIGERAARQITEFDPADAAGYVLLSNIYAALDD